MPDSNEPTGDLQDEQYYQTLEGLEYAIRRQAAEMYACNDIEFDANAKISEADDGCWVQAWVWVPYPDRAGGPGPA